MLRDWLKIQRDRLSDTDADGPLALADLYEEMLQDRVTAIELCVKHGESIPTSQGDRRSLPHPGISQGSERLGRVGPEKPRSIRLTGRLARTVRPADRRVCAVSPPKRFSQRLGVKPDRISYIGSKGQLIEQWIYLDSGGPLCKPSAHSWRIETKGRRRLYPAANQCEGRPWNAPR